MHKEGQAADANVEKAKDLLQLQELEKVCAEIRARHAVPTEFLFPAIGENLGGHHVDQNHGILWIGIKINQFDFMGACAFLKSYELQLWMVYRDLAIKQSMRGRLTAAAGATIDGAKKALGLGR